MNTDHSTHTEVTLRHFEVEPRPPEFRLTGDQDFRAGVKIQDGSFELKSFYYNSSKLLLSASFTEQTQTEEGCTNTRSIFKAATSFSCCHFKAEGV